MIVPSDLQRAAIHAMQQTLATIARDGDSSAMATSMVTFKDREAIIGTEDWNELNRRFRGMSTPEYEVYALRYGGVNIPPN